MKRTPVALILLAAVLAGGCDFGRYRKMQERFDELSAEHDALKEEHEALRDETRALLAETLKNRGLSGLTPFDLGTRIELRQGYVEAVQAARGKDGHHLAVDVDFDIHAGSGRKPDFEVFFHDTTGRVIGHGGKKTLLKKVGTDLPDIQFEVELGTPIAPAYVSVLVR